MRWWTLAATVIGAVACSHAPFYTGNGHFTDNGFMAYSRRFVIDLGPVNLSKMGTYNYILSGLPQAEFVISIRVIEETTNTLNGKPDYPAVVRVHLQNDRNETVIDEQAPLNSWVRSYGTLDNVSELYREGEEREVPIAGGYRGEKLGVKASGGWGTYFYSDEGEKYKLRVDVLASSMNRPASVVVLGWSR
jgi:hypothetical protein